VGGRDRGGGQGDMEMDGGRGARREGGREIEIERETGREGARFSSDGLE